MAYRREEIGRGGRGEKRGVVVVLVVVVVRTDWSFLVLVVVA